MYSTGEAAPTVDDEQNVHLVSSMKTYNNETNMADYEVIFERNL